MNRIFAFAAACLLFSGVAAASTFPKECYLDLMQDAFEAYTPERLEDYISRVDAEGVKEHGYGRVTANLGILIAHGRLADHKDIFERMMDIAAREMPVAHMKMMARKGRGEEHSGVGNDFAVKEICCCLEEVEKSGLFPEEKIGQWRKAFTDMKAEEIYTCQPELGENRAYNWCVFGGASECARMMLGVGGDRAFVDRYFTDQLRWFDENGMFIDPGAPMVYDFVTRLQFMAALSFGYDGPARAAIEENLLKSALPSLWMQSVTGEMPYGGRSNQFLHNETVYTALCEYYACWFKSRGDMALASRFRAAASRAASSITYWLNQKPVRHIKNRYPTETSYGCEKYAYFDKYMITMASWAYLAYRFADDSIPAADAPEKASTFVTSGTFHRVMMNAGGYTVEIDLDAEKKYDSSGIGRFQKAGASPVVALASPCAGVPEPKFRLDIVNEGPLAISPEWEKYEIVSARPGRVILTDGKSTWKIRLGRRGVKMVLKGSGELKMTIPAFEFDGEKGSVIVYDGKSLSVDFDGNQCEWKVCGGMITDSGRVYANRNGHLRRYDATSPARGSRSHRLVLRARIF